MAAQVMWNGMFTRLAPYMAVLGLMATVAALVMHVQVATRFLSVCPALYWFCAVKGAEHRAFARAIVVYSLAWGMLGSLMFTNFYPWT